MASVQVLEEHLKASGLPTIVGVKEKDKVMS